MFSEDMQQQLVVKNILIAAGKMAMPEESHLLAQLGPAGDHFFEPVDIEVSDCFPLLARQVSAHISCKRRAPAGIHCILVQIL